LIDNDPNLLVVQLVAASLGDLMNELVLVGGCAVGLLITDGSRPPIRQTIDVDVVAEVTTKVQYYDLRDRLVDLGFRDNENSDVICRFTKGELVLDVMSTEENVLGFSNEWYEDAARRPLTTRLPNGVNLRHISAPLFLATKITSFHGRGGGDFMHHDIEDIVNLVDGRAELADEIDAEVPGVSEFIRDEIDGMLGNPQFTSNIVRHFHPSEDHVERLAIVLERLRRIAGV